MRATRSYLLLGFIPSSTPNAYSIVGIEYVSSSGEDFAQIKMLVRNKVLIKIAFIMLV